MAQPTRSMMEQAARARGFKGNPELAEQFQTNNEYTREIVKVAALPDPPMTETVERIVPGKKRGKSKIEAISLEDAVTDILKKHAQELETKLAKVKVEFSSREQQELVDYVMAILTGAVGGGALARR